MATGVISDPSSPYVEVTMVHNNTDQSWTASTSTQKILLDKINDGHGFSLSGNDIVIPSGVHHVRVDGSVYLKNNYTNTSISCGILKNGTSICRGLIKYSENYVTVPVPPKIIPVTSGDKISLYIVSGSNPSSTTTVTISNDNTGTYMTVEKVD